jgi:hypothetical protein
VKHGKSRILWGGPSPSRLPPAYGIEVCESLRRVRIFPVKKVLEQNTQTQTTHHLPIIELLNYFSRFSRFSRS